MKNIILIFCINFLSCLNATKSPVDINGGSSPLVTIGAFYSLANTSISSNSSSNTDSITYATKSLTLTKDFAMGDQTPTIVGTVSGFSSNPTLPSGISIHSSTGVISGTPTANQAATSYTISANGTSNSTSTDLSITVTSDPPSNFSYNGASSGMSTGSTATALLFRRTIAASITPTVTGSATFSISPTLPSGLSLNSSTGVISGTPTVSQLAGNYTVTATNQFGSTNVSFTIAVLPVIYAATFGGGLAISTDDGNSFTMRTVAGGTLDSVSVCNDGTILFNERNTGIYKSNNSGLTFVLIQSLGQSHNVFCDPSNPAIIYSASNGQPNPLYRSINGGASFSQLTIAQTFVSSISYSNSTYYISSQSGGVTGAYKSTDGINFSNIISTAVSDIFSTNAKVYATQGNTIQVSVNNGTSFSLLSNIPSAYKITASANDLNIYVGTTGNGLYISINSGSTFNSKTMANGLLSNSVQTVFLDIHGVVYVGTSAGISISTDGGNTFVTKNNGLTNFNIQKIIVK